MGNWQNIRKHNTQESQEVSLFPAGEHKAPMDGITKTNMTYKLQQEVPPWNGQIKLNTVMKPKKA